MLLFCEIQPWAAIPTTFLSGIQKRQVCVCQNNTNKTAWNIISLTETSPYYDMRIVGPSLCEILDPVMSNQLSSEVPTLYKHGYQKSDCWFQFSFAFLGIENINVNFVRENGYIDVWGHMSSRAYTFITVWSIPPPTQVREE